MFVSPLFAIGQREISPAAQSRLATLNLNPDPFFTRHESGDWGDAPDWLRNDNDSTARKERASQAIRSYYRLTPEVELTVVTAPDRSRTRLMLTEEFTEKEVSVREGYALWASSYDGANPLIAVEEPVVDALLATLPPLTNAIDVGTGTGRLACKLAHRGVAAIRALDTTPEMLAVAREKAQREGLSALRFEPFTLGNEPLPVASDSFDLLTCGLMLCHVANLREMIADYVRVVRPGGWLLLTDFHPAVSFFGWQADFVVPEGRLLLPQTRCTRADYLEPLTEAGCTLLSVQDIALDGSPYGEVSETIMKAKGWPPLCLVILAQKRNYCQHDESQR